MTTAYVDLAQTILCRDSMLISPRYLVDYCAPVSEVPSCQHLRSVRRRQLSVPSVRRSMIGSRALSVTGPTVCGSLPGDLRDPAVDYEHFRLDLKHIH